MSLKNDYLTGPNGLEQNVSEAFAAGVAFVGTGVADVESLYLGDRSGANLGAGSAQPGYYFLIYGPTGGYQVWFSVSGEVAPSSVGLTPVQVALSSGDSSSQVAVKIAAALNALPNQDFTVINVGGALESTASSPKALNPLVLGPSGWGTAAAAVVTAGVNPTGNYLTISNALKSYAQLGRTEFRITLPTTYNSQALRSNHGNNLILKAYFAGIVSAFSSEDVYSYEVKPVLNLSDKATTSVDLHFNFSYNQKNHKDITYDLPPYVQPTD